MLEKGNIPAENMLQAAHDSNKIRTWLIRLICFFMMFAGLKTILAPLKTLANVVPILGSIVGGVTGVVAFLLALVFFLTVLSIAWIAARPVLGVVLLAVAVAAIIAGVFIYKKKTKKAVSA